MAYCALAAFTLQGMHSYTRRTLPAAFKTFCKALGADDSGQKVTSLGQLLCASCQLPKQAGPDCCSALHDLSGHGVVDFLPVAAECAPEPAQISAMHRPGMPSAPAPPSV